MVIKKYSGCYDKKEFYGFMGRFFAEPSYRKLMPYLNNPDDTIWYLAMAQAEVLAFASYQLTTTSIIFHSDYYEKGQIQALKKIIQRKLSDLGDNDMPIITAVMKPEIITLYQKEGFEIYRASKNYTHLKLEKKNAEEVN